MKTSGVGKGDLPFGDMRNARGDLLFMAGDTRVNEHTGLYLFILCSIVSTTELQHNCH